MIRCAVFDFDGTLVDSNQIKRTAFYAVVEDVPQGRAVLDRILTSGEVGDRYDVFQRLSEHFEAVPEHWGSRTRVQWRAALTHRYSALCEGLISQCPELKGATAALVALSSVGLSVLVNSSTPRIALLRILRRRGLMNILDAAYGGPRSKVDNLRHIMARIDLSPDEVVVVGDGEDDRLSAVEVGCAFLPVGRGSVDVVAAGRQPVQDLALLPSLIESLDVA